MMRKFALALALGSALVALEIPTAYAQTTEQTDKSEEDWRKSKKKSTGSGSEIFDKIFNTNNGGWGTTPGPQSPVDSLPQESRRHVMKERARVIAETDPGATPDDTYNPSEAAKKDADLAKQEKEAWDVIITDLKSDQNAAPGAPGNGPNKIAIAGQGGGHPQNSSVMRGGSTATVAEILEQIKGIKAGGTGGNSPSGAPNGSRSTGQSPTGQSPLGQSQIGRSPLGQSPPGQSPSGQNTGNGQGSTGVPSQSTGQTQRSNGSSGQSGLHDKALTTGQSDQSSLSATNEAGQGQSTQNGAQTGSGQENGTDSDGVDQSAGTPSTQSPLDIIKAKGQAGSNGGTQSSASDYLKRSTDPDN